MSEKASRQPEPTDGAAMKRTRAKRPPIGQSPSISVSVPRCFEAGTISELVPDGLKLLGEPEDVAMALNEGVAEAIVRGLEQANWAPSGKSARGWFQRVARLAGDLHRELLTKRVPAEPPPGQHTVEPDTFPALEMVVRHTPGPAQDESYLVDHAPKVLGILVEAANEAVARMPLEGKGEKRDELRAVLCFFLAGAHWLAFQRPPRVKNNLREWGGPSITWARNVITRAADRCDAAGTEEMRAPFGRLRQLADTQNENIGKALSKGWRDFETARSKLPQKLQNLAAVELIQRAWRLYFVRRKRAHGG